MRGARRVQSAQVMLWKTVRSWAKRVRVKDCSTRVVRGTLRIGRHSIVCQAIQDHGTYRDAFPSVADYTVVHSDYNQPYASSRDPWDPAAFSRSSRMLPTTACRPATKFDSVALAPYIGAT